MLLEYNNNNNNNNSAFASAGILATMEPHGLTRSGWEKARWANSGPLAKRETLVIVCKASGPRSRFSSWTGNYSQVGDIFGFQPVDFQPVAVEALGPLNESACEFLNNLGWKIGDNTGDDRSTSFLFQQISILVQRFNAVLLNDSFMLEHHSPVLVFIPATTISLIFCSTFGYFLTEGLKNNK